MAPGLQFANLVGVIWHHLKVPNGYVVHDLPEHGRRDDRLAVAGQQRVVTSVDDLSLQQPAVEGLPGWVDAWVADVGERSEVREATEVLRAAATCGPLYLLSGGTAHDSAAAAW